MNLTIQQINKAAKRVEGIVKDTPLQLSQRLSKQYSASIYLKREDLQEVRSFKIRGAFNKMATLTEEEKKKGIVSASAGNHAQGVAYSCAHLKIKGVIFMPTSTPTQKIERVKHFGKHYIEIKLAGNTYDEAGKAAKQYCSEKNLVYIHPFDDPEVIAGQATVAKEIYDTLCPEFIIAPIGGGGLISGIASYSKQRNPATIIIGAEPLGAPSMYEAVHQQKIITIQSIDTFIDGAAVQTAGNNTYQICKQLVDKIFLIPEGKDCATMIELYQNEGIIAEPAGALAVAALDAIADKINGKTVVCIISGGNNDILRYPEIMERSLVYQGRKHYFIFEFAQKPGQLRQFVDQALGPTDDIVRFEYMKKTNKEKGAALVGIELKDKKDLEPLLQRLKTSEINFRILTDKELLYSYII